MIVKDVLERASSGLEAVAKDWMPATGTRALIIEDPILVWLDIHGEANGFRSDSPPYDFTEFIFEKGRLFEQKWIAEMAPEAVGVCKHAGESRLLRSLAQTAELIHRDLPGIAAPALWWAPERVYGVPDLIVLSSWLRERFPSIDLRPESTDQYIVLDMKFTTKLDSSNKKLDLLNYAAQVRIYSYIVGMLTGTMADQAFIVCRDRIDDPLPVTITSEVGEPLDADLGNLRDRYLDIKLNGATFRPGTDQRIQSNLQNQKDDPWHSAKVQIARELRPGGDPCLLYWIGTTQRLQLSAHGYGSLEDLMQADPGRLPLESCKGLGAAKCPRIRAVLSANSSGAVVPETLSNSPPEKAVELYVDFETFNNLNVDFDSQWPTLEGFEMIFMVGIGWEENGQWSYEAIIADAENQLGERALLEWFEAFIKARAERQGTNGSSLVLYHWTSAEVWQLRNACDRHKLDPTHRLRLLPWFDIQKDVFLKEPIGVPGTLKYGLKGVATALGLVEWPGNLDDGLGASVAGWKAYKEASPSESPHMKTVREYNEVDCRALHEIVKWLRSR